MHEDEGGLTLVEMMVAIMLIGIIMMAMASVLVTSAYSIRGSERVVHSTQLGNQMVEELLALPFEHAALYEDDAEDHYGGSTFEDKDLVLLPEPDDIDDREPRVPAAVRTVEHEGIEFTVETAVVWVDDDGTDEAQDYKRLVIMLTWEHRGEERTARTEAMRSPDPAEHPLRATVIPDVIRLVDRGDSHNAGMNDGEFEVHVRAVEPQSGVQLTYLDRYEEESASKNFTAVAGSEKTEWVYKFDNNSESFANGGTLFEVTGTSLVGDVERTTMGRGVFLHDLEFEPELVSLDVVEPDDDGNVPVRTEDGSAEACSGLELEATVTGAMRNDPLTLYFLDGPEGERLGEVLEGEDEPRPHSADAIDSTIYGATYELSLQADDLHFVDDADSVIVELVMGRSADDAEPVFHEETVGLTWLEEGEPCPA